MKNSLLLMAMILTALLNFSCSKSPGKTSSKIKIVSGNFAALLTNKANNGLFFYGRSNDGKVFTKKIDNDTVDMVFPNGTWNLFAISYELGTAPAAGVLPNFTGKTYCGKTSVTLNGTDTSIQIDLTNAGCNDPAFSNQTVLVSGEYKLPFFNIINCKSLANTNYYSSCDNNASTNWNKGYATSYRLVAYETKNFGDPVAPAKIAESPCLRTSYTNQAGFLGDPSSSFAIPTNPGAGIHLALEVFYGGGSPLSATGCDGSKGVDVIPLIDGPRMKLGMDVSTTPRNALLFVRTADVDVCRDPRLSASSFASGMGFPGSPYTVCSKNQLDLLRTNFTTYKDTSIDLLVDIDYNMAFIQPIGNPLLNSGGSPTDAYGKGAAAYMPFFNGNGHKISNFMIDCKTPAGTAPNDEVGFFRRIENAIIMNLTFNNGLVWCDSGNNVGIVAGKVENTQTTNFENIRIHGHAEGMDYVGGLFGSHVATASGAIDVRNVHVKGDFNGHAYVGGLIGMSISASSANISQVTFNGSLYGGHHNSGSNPIASFVGGIIGYVDTSSGAVNIAEAVVKGKRLEGSMYLGGLAGKSINTNISNAYSMASLRSSYYTDGTTYFTRTGGAVGYATSTSLTNVLALETIKSVNKSGTDTTLGGLVGDATTTTCTGSFYDGTHDGYSCGTQMTYSQARSRVAYSGIAIPYEFAQWDAAAFPAQYETSIPSCSPSQDGRYITVTTAQSSTTHFGAVLPGDIILCNGSSNTLVPLLSVSTALASYPWRMTDEGYDIPRLAFEEKVENLVPYLKRPCIGKFASQYGAGTETDPKWICSPSQFAGMNSSNFYALKKDIHYDQGGGSFTPMPAGPYKLDGNGFGLYNYMYTFPTTVTGNLEAGLFAKLTTGGVIKNLRLVNSSMSAATVNTASFPWIRAGLLVGWNEGTLQNISVEMSKVNIFNLTLVAGDDLNVGGVVGYNNGLMKKVDSDANVVIDQGSYPASSRVVAGGMAGININTIEASRSHASVGRMKFCSSAETLSFADTEYLAPFVGINTSSGILREVSSEGEFRASFPSGSCNYVMSGHVSAFVAKNEGVIQDFEVQPKFWFQNSTPPWVALFDFYNGASASVSRGLVTIESSVPNSLFNQTLTQVGTWDASIDSAGSTMGTCSLADSGKWFDISNPNAATSFGPVTTTDRMVCNGAAWIKVPDVLQPQLFNKGMSDVIYLVRNQSTPPLAAGRYLEDALTFSIPSAGTLSVKQAGTAIPNFTGTGWTVTTDFFNPGTNAWNLNLFNGATSTIEPPELSKVHGGPEELGAPF